MKAKEMTSPKINEKENRLFVPLNTGPYRAFESGEKTWELRGINDRFNRDTIFTGRVVELRRGYSTDDSIWGVIEAVETFGSPEEIVGEFDYERIRPGASEKEFLESVNELLGQYDEYIAFRVTEIKGESPQL